MDQSPRNLLLPALTLVLMLGGWSSAHTQNVSEQYLLAAANQDRLARGLAPLQSDEHLFLAAQRHAAEMARRQAISHQFPGEAGLAERAGEAGAHFSLVTENVAEAPNSALIHELWMKSAGHRANLLDPHVTVVGIAVLQSHGQLYAVEDFAQLVETISLNEQEAMVADTLTRSGVRVSTGSQDARDTCSLSTGFVGSRHPWFVMRYTSSDIHRLPEELLTRLQTGKYHQAEIGACSAQQTPFSAYSLAVLLFP